MKHLLIGAAIGYLIGDRFAARRTLRRLRHKAEITIHNVSAVDSTAFMDEIHAYLRGEA